MPDLSLLCDSDGNFQRRPRPVGRSLKYTDSDGLRRCHARVEIGIIGDDNSWLEISSAEVWRDRGGFTLTAPDLLTWYPYQNAVALATASGGSNLQALYGKYSYIQMLRQSLAGSGSQRVRFRLTGAVETDNGVHSTAAWRTESAWPFLSQRTVYSPQRFRSRSNPSEYGGSYDTVDDSDAAEARAVAVRDAADNAMGHGSIILRGVSTMYRPGQAIAATRGYVRDLSIDYGGRKLFPLIASVVFDFSESGRSTELLLDTPMLRVSR